METNTVGVRKGAWTLEEDILLRKCIENFGEGKWHLVPLRAGLNRCRKSCRLRWLNYLKPNIKRGQFNKDEVDLIIRLHKLLGNRWSLIAGRLPGRTANDVKNFWNSHIDKKLLAGETGRSNKPQKTINPTNIVRPRPRTFSNNNLPRRSEPNIVWTSDDQNPKNPLSSAAAAAKASSHETDEIVRWWRNLLETTMEEDGAVAGDEGRDQAGMWRGETSAGLPENNGGGGGARGGEDDDVEGFGDLFIDVDVWELLSFGDEI